MTTWNYRVTRTVTPDETLFDIREVYYEDDRIVSWTATEVGPSGDSLEDLKAAMLMYRSALKKPVIDISDEANPFEVTE